MQFGFGLLVAGLAVKFGLPHADFVLALAGLLFFVFGFIVQCGDTPTREDSLRQEWMRMSSDNQ